MTTCELHPAVRCEHWAAVWSEAGRLDFPVGVSVGVKLPDLRSNAGAGDRNRTRNLLFTKQLLCQLSYAGILGEG
jgi:hypothetical protein